MIWWRYRRIMCGRGDEDGIYCGLKLLYARSSFISILLLVKPTITSATLENFKTMCVRCWRMSHKSRGRGMKKRIFTGISSTFPPHMASNVSCNIESEKFSKKYLHLRLPQQDVGWIFRGWNGICLNENENFPSSNAKVFPTNFSRSSPEGSELMRSTETSKFSSYQRATSWNLIEFLYNLHWTLWGIENFFSNFTYSILSALSLGSLPGFFRSFFFLFNHMFLFWQSQWWGWGSKARREKERKKNVGKHVIFVIFFFSLLFLVRSKNQCGLCFINKLSFHVVRERQLSENLWNSLPCTTRTSLPEEIKFSWKIL